MKNFPEVHFRSRADNCERSTSREQVIERLQNKSIRKNCSQHSILVVDECRTTASET